MIRVRSNIGEWVSEEGLDEAMQNVAERIKESVATTIRVGGRPQSFLPTQAGNHPLIRTGRLLSNLTAESGRNYARVRQGVQGMRHPSIPWVLHFGAEIRAKNKPYLVFRVGNRLVFTKRVYIPPRPYMVLQTEDEEWILKEVTNAIILPPKQEI